jgi:nucleoside-diphosphate kinase
MKKVNILWIFVAICAGFFLAQFANKFRHFIFKESNSMSEKTFAIIKPDAVAAKNSGKIIDRIEQEGFNIVAMKKLQLTTQQAEKFYEVHKARPFFAELVNFMTSGPVVVMVLEKTNAVQAWRDLMGSTDPKESAPKCIRRLFGTDKGKNATHGSDSIENAKIEIKLFFPEIV